MSSKAMENHLFNLKFAAKDLERNAKKSERDEKSEKSKAKAAIAKGNIDGARVHAENSIRNHNQAQNYRLMGSRIDGVAQRVQTAITTRQVTQSMAGVCKAMETAMRSMNLEKVTQLMDQFEKNFDNLDINMSVMDDAMKGTNTLNTPQAAVDGLLKEVADEAGLELNFNLPSAATAEAVATANVDKEQDDLSKRLAALRDR